ncbi:MAG: hypothetical protein AAF438_07025 [Pseudomonadota bacterium]
MAKTFFLIVMFVLPALCWSDGRPTLFEAIDGVLHHPLNTAEDVHVIALSDGKNSGFRQPLWGVYTPSKRSLSLFRTTLETTLPSVGGIFVSSNDTFMAVVTNGESGPAVDIFKLSSVLQDSKSPLSPVQSFATHHGVIEVIRWERDHILKVRSDAELDRFDSETGRLSRARYEFQGQTFRDYYWNVETGQFTLSQ